MKPSNLLMLALTTSLWACGPDAMAVVGEDEVDGVEAYDAELTTTSRSLTWFPMQAGNVWNYKNSSGATRTVTLTQVGSNMAVLTGLHAEPTWVGLANDAATTLYQWNGTDWESLIRFGYSTTTWKTNSNACSGLVGRRSGTGTSFTTPAGTFTDTRTISFAQITAPNVRCSAPEFGELTFVPNVGLVSFKTGGNQRFNLVSAVVDGRAFPVPSPSSDVTAAVVLDKASYVSIPNTIRCITVPCPSNAQTAEARVELQLKNLGSTSVTWPFATTCQFDVELVTASGRVVRKLSEGRSCGFSTTSLTLGAGQSKVFSANVPLADRDGLQLSGSYTVRAKLIPSSNASDAPAASSSFAVTVLDP